MKKVLVALVLVALMVAPVMAQAPKVSLSKGTFSWTPGQGVEPATEFRMYCGNTADALALAATTPAANSTMPVSDAITTGGEYFCAVAAANDFGESDKSNVVNFIAGDAPGTPTNLNIGTVPR